MAWSVLGVDVAQRRWTDNGTAWLELDDAGRVVRVSTGILRWPEAPLSASALAEAIDGFARAHGVAAVALDGPQGWRDPQTSTSLPGVGRRCEFQCRTQGKTGAHPMTYPGTQRAWIEHSIALFDSLLARPDVVLANSHPIARPGSGYVLLECFPTSTWRAAGLRALPGKRKRPELKPYIQALTDAFDLPPFETSSHDDLQAVVAALAAAAALGADDALPRGVQAAVVSFADGISRRAEGYIWDARPRG